MFANFDLWQSWAFEPDRSPGKARLSYLTIGQGKPKLESKFEHRLTTKAKRKKILKEWSDRPDCASVAESIIYEATAETDKDRIPTGNCWMIYHESYWFPITFCTLQKSRNVIFQDLSYYLRSGPIGWSNSYIGRSEVCSVGDWEIPYHPSTAHHCLALLGSFWLCLALLGVAERHSRTTILVFK